MSPVSQDSVSKNLGRFEDFWRRQLTARLELEFEFEAFGTRVRIQANRPELLAAGDLSSARYSRSAAGDIPSATVILVCDEELPADLLPRDLPGRLQTFGLGHYLFQALSPWVQWWCDLDARLCCAFVSPALGADARVVSRYLIDRALLNFFTHAGLGQLHATTVVRGQRVVLLVAPHGTGKSATAFGLMQRGYRLMGDGLVFVRPRESDELELLAYPVGEAKLTPEIADLFPGWRGEGEEVTVHNVNKRVVNLRALAPDRVVEDSVSPREIVLCLLARDESGTTRIEQMDTAAAFEALVPDSIFLDDPTRMARSLDAVHALVERAARYRVNLGRSREDTVSAIETLQSVQ